MVIKLIQAIVSLIKLVLNVKKWITAPYRIVMFTKNHPMIATIYVAILVIALVLIYRV